MMALKKEYIIIGAGVLLIVIAFMLGRTSKGLEPLDETPWERKLDSLQSLYLEAIDSSNYWESKAEAEAEVRDSLMSSYVELKKNQIKIRYVKVYDSLRDLTDSELQEYFSKRYPE